MKGKVASRASWAGSSPAVWNSDCSGGADHVGRAERLDRGQPLHQRPSTRHPPDGAGQREGDDRQQPLGDVADQRPDRGGQSEGDRQPGESDPGDEEDDPEAIAFLGFLASIAAGEFLPTRRKPILVASLGVSLITFALLIFGQEMIGEFEGVAAAFGYFGATVVTLLLVQMLPPRQGIWEPAQK